MLRQRDYPGSAVQVSRAAVRHLRPAPPSQAYLRLSTLVGEVAQVDWGSFGAQIQLRNNQRLQAAMRSSRLPAVKQLRDFDFTFQLSLRREQIESLRELGFVERRENAIFLRPPGSARRTWRSVSRSPRRIAAGRARTGISELVHIPGIVVPLPLQGCYPPPHSHFTMTSSFPNNPITVRRNGFDGCDMGRMRHFTSRE